MSYTVEIKTSASLGNPIISRIAVTEGIQRTFPSKEDANEWAEGLNKQVENSVHIQDASPVDSDPTVDGYLVSD